jgi:hypothetical protein
LRSSPDELPPAAARSPAAQPPPGRTDTRGHARRLRAALLDRDSTTRLVPRRQRLHLPHPPPPPGEPLAFLAHIFATLGNPIVAALSVAIAWALIDDDLGPRYGILVLATVGAVAINALLKAILGPTPLETSTRGTLASGNFPSGHVVYITSLCILLGWFALARGHRATFAAMLLPILGMGPFRILDGAHWPSDVLAGYTPSGSLGRSRVLGVRATLGGGTQTHGEPPVTSTRLWSHGD